MSTFSTRFGIHGFLFFPLSLSSSSAVAPRGVGVTLRAQLSRAGGFVDRWAHVHVGVPE